MSSCEGQLDIKERIFHFLFQASARLGYRCALSELFTRGSVGALLKTLPAMLDIADETDLSYRL